MTDLEWMGPEPDDRESRKCRHPKWQRSTVYEGILPAYQKCDGCGHVFDEADRKRGRNNRTRGVSAELDVARLFRDGRKVGPLGLPWDVVVPGRFRLQVKKLARWPSITQALDWLDAMEPGDETRGVVVIGVGRGARRLLIVDLNEFADREGDK